MRLPLLLLSISPVLLSTPAVCATAQEEKADATWSELVERGRALFEKDKLEKAEALFAQAVTKAPAEFDARFWQARCWIALDRVNDALNATDDLSAKGVKGPAIDYLYGMAFHRKAVGYISSGVDGGSIAMSFGDAVSFLENATSADPVRFADAFAPLAESAWQSQNLSLAREAGEKAVTADPKDGDAHLLLGRICMSQFTVARGDGSASEESDVLLARALDAFESAVKAFGKPKDAYRIGRKADAYVQVAYCHAWREDKVNAAKAYGQAMGWNPGSVDFDRVRGTVGENADFIACLNDGGKKYAKRYGADHAGDATLRWWLGWSSFTELAYPEAEAAFTDAVAKFPEFVNSWFFIALSRYHQKKYDGAIEAFTHYWELDPSDAIRSMSGGQDTNIAILDYLVGKCAGGGKNYEAGVLSEMQAETAQKVDRFWNNVGLFYRDAGEALADKKKEEDVERRNKLYEASWKGYARAIELKPDNPIYLNDGAVILHYYLDRDLEKARDMYRKARTKAEELLARETLKKDERDGYEVALRDAKNNLRRLEEELEKKKKAE